MGRVPCCSKVGLQRGVWTAREDMLLTKFIQANGEGQWRDLPKKAGLLRCGKSCRLRWLNYLRPDIKRGNITPVEEELIVRMHRLLGNRWSLIAGRLPGRTDNEVKNFWNTQLRKKLLSRGIDPKTHKPLSNKEEVEESADVAKKRGHFRRQRKDVDSDSDAQARSIHIPKANRCISFPRSWTSSDSQSNDAGIGLEVPSIDLDSGCSMSSLKSSQDFEYSSSGMVCNLSPVNDDHVWESIFPQQANNNPQQDCFLWPCMDEREAWSVLNSQSTPEGIEIPKSISYVDVKHTIEDELICSTSTTEEHMELLQRESPSNINGDGISISTSIDREDIYVFPEYFSSMWDCLVYGDDLRDEDVKRPNILFVNKN